jgi:hypothetical protein
MCCARDQRKRIAREREREGNEAALASEMETRFEREITHSWSALDFMEPHQEIFEGGSAAAAS